MNQIGRGRYAFVDLLKAIAIYMVIIYHFSSMPLDFLSNNHPAVYFNYFLNSVFATCVPLFFFTNGMLLLNKTSIDVRKHAIKVLKIIALTVIWGLITLLALSFIWQKPLSVVELVKGSFFLKKDWNEHLWFLGTLVILYIFYPLLQIAFNTNKPAFYFVFVCVMLFTFGNTLVGNILTAASYFLGKFNKTNFRDNYWGIFNPFKGIYGYAIGYFMLGGILLQYKDVLASRRNRNLAIAGLAISITIFFLYAVLVSVRNGEMWDNVWYGYDAIFTLLNVVFIFIISLRYQSTGRLGTVISLVGQNSLGIYFIHIILGNLILPYYSQLAFFTSTWANLIFVLIILLSSLGATLLLKKVPVVKWLFSI